MVIIKRKSGFTIVELLIVIVVIAILAAITIAAYNEVRTRAVDTRIVSDLTNIAKQIELYNVTNGSYPASTGQAASMGSKLSASLGAEGVLLCGDATNGFAVFARDPTTTKQYKVEKGVGAKILSPPVSWSSVQICASTSYPVIAWGYYWLTAY